MTKKTTFYDKQEERLNIISHALGFVLSLIALVLLVRYAAVYGNVWHITSFAIFGGSLILLYAASTLYHYTQSPKLRLKLNVIDHAAIYVLIAGTYTPFTLVVLKGWLGWTLFGISWGLAIAGILFKLFFFGRFDKLSTAMYIGMGWVIIFAIKPLIDSFPLEGLLWLFGGGLSYTVGALIYSMKGLRYNHAIFHVFVLIGSFCHFMAVFFYVLPSPSF